MLNALMEKVSTKKIDSKYTECIVKVTFFKQWYAAGQIPLTHLLSHGMILDG